MGEKKKKKTFENVNINMYLIQIDLQKNRNIIIYGQSCDVYKTTEINHCKRKSVLYITKTAT